MENKKNNNTVIFAIDIVMLYGFLSGLSFLFAIYETTYIIPGSEYIGPQIVCVIGIVSCIYCAVKAIKIKLKRRKK